MNRQINSNRHSVYSLKYHLVVITKYRHKCINPEILDELEKIFTRLLNNKDCKVLEFGGEKDYEEHLKNYYWKSAFWSRSYCIISTGGATIETIEEYIQSQGEKEQNRLNSSPPESN